VDSEAPEAAPDGGRSLFAAVITAVILVVILVSCYFLGNPAFFVLICIVALAALFELLDALKQSGRRPPVVFGLLCGFAFLYVAYIEKPAFFGIVLVATTFGGLLLGLQPGRGRPSGSDIAWLVLGVTWITGGGAAAVAITKLPDGMNLILMTVVLAALFDISAYFVGTAFGRHKMAPSISPAKSWEGFAGGVVAALAGGLVAALLLDEITLIHGLDVGLIVGLFAPSGDLVESAVKREIGIKDSSRFLPGHGGFLDRLDGILFCMPPVFLYLRFVVF
jgi:phosphatidate cytidylyltransferase